MNHDDAAPHLSEFLQGRLEGERRDAVAQHLSDCDECRALAETYSVLRGAAPRSAEISGAAHPSTMEIATCAALPGKLEVADLARIGAHLHECRACAEEVEVTRRAHASVGRRMRRGGIGLFRGLLRTETWRVGLGLAAGILIAVLAYPAYLGLVDLPRVAGDAKELTHEKEALASEAQSLRSSFERAQEDLDRARSWTGAVGLRVLSGRFRGEQPANVVAVAAGQPFVVIAVLPSVPEEAADDLFVFEIRREDGEAVWSLEMSAEKIRVELRASQVVTFLIPAGSIPPARYTLRMLPKGGTKGHPAFEINFEVVAARGE